MHSFTCNKNACHLLFVHYLFPFLSDICKSGALQAGYHTVIRSIHSILNPILTLCHHEHEYIKVTHKR